MNKMTNVELLNKYVRACIEIDREEKNYILKRPLIVSLKEKDNLEKEILRRLNNSSWHTGMPIEDGLYAIAFKYKSSQGFTEYIHEQLAIFKDGRWQFNVDCKILAWYKIEQYEEIEEPYKNSEKDELMTNRQLAEWCSMGNGLWMHNHSNTGTVYHHYWFQELEMNDKVPNNILIMSRGSDDWVKPTLYVYLRDCKEKMDEINVTH